MRALQLTEWKTTPRLVDVPTPEAGPGQVVVKIGGAGACHSDLHIYQDFSEGMMPWGPPFILGHENAGWVHQVGAGVDGLEPGQPVAVYGLWGCGQCKACAAGAENYCARFAERPAGVGIGVDGGMAEYLLVPEPRRLVPLGDVDPVEAAPLTDAALTPYHAVKTVLPKLVPGSYAVVIGAGGLGHFAVQILTALSPATVIALDTRAEALELARSVGAAHTIQSGPDTADEVRGATKGAGAQVVLDCVGVDDTISLAMSVTRSLSDVVVLGAAGGGYQWSFYALPYGVRLSNSVWGTLPELHEVIALAESGHIKGHVERIPLDSAMDAFHKMESGQLLGRAVIVP